MKKVSDPTDDPIAMRLRKQSGTFLSRDPLECFLYVLMRDWVTPGAVEYVMIQLTKEYEVYGDAPTPLTNGWLGQYARDVALRLKQKPKKLKWKRAKAFVTVLPDDEVRPAEAIVSKNKRLT